MASAEPDIRIDNYVDIILNSVWPTRAELQ